MKNFFYYEPIHTDISVLCCSITSVYKEIYGLDFYDINRCYSSFGGVNPVVCHPPCRSWSRFLSHQAKPLPGEKLIGPNCVDLLKTNGGVLEHPAHSNLFDYCGLPEPFDFTHREFFTVAVNQSWFGYPSKKPTWLLLPKSVEHLFFVPKFFIPLIHINEINSIGSREFRSLTTRPFAEFLLKVASLSSHSSV